MSTKTDSLVAYFDALRGARVAKKMEQDALARVESLHDKASVELRASLVIRAFGDDFTRDQLDSELNVSKDEMNRFLRIATADANGMFFRHSRYESPWKNCFHLFDPKRK